MPFAVCLAALTLALERKTEEHEALYASYAAMRQQMLTLRTAAFTKLGLPPPADTEQPSAATSGSQLAGEASVADESSDENIRLQPPPPPPPQQQPRRNWPDS